MRKKSWGKTEQEGDRVKEDCCVEKKTTRERRIGEI